jgi:hypothetical protein
LKQKLESGEGGVRSEELEDLKRKLGAKLLDTESQLEAALTKASALEKNNNRLKGELEDLSIEVERVSVKPYCSSQHVLSRARCVFERCHERQFNVVNSNATSINSYQFSVHVQNCFV